MLLPAIVVAMMSAPPYTKPALPEEALNPNLSWESAVCYTQKYKRSRTYVTECQPRPVDAEKACEGTDTYFHLRMSARSTKRECQELRYDHFRNRPGPVFFKTEAGEVQIR